MDEYDHLNVHTDSDDSDLFVEKVVVFKKHTSVTTTNKFHTSASTTAASGYNSKQIKPINLLTNGNGGESDEDELPDIPEENYYCFTQQQSPPKKFKTSLYDSSAAGAGSTTVTQKPLFSQAQSSKTKANHINRVLDLEDDLLDLDFENYSSNTTTNTSSKAVTNGGKSTSSNNSSSKNSGSSSSSSYKNLMEAISKSSSSSSTSKDEYNVERIGTTKPTTSKSQSQRTKPVKGTLSSASSISGSSSTATESQKRKEKDKEDKEREKQLKRLEREQKKQELEKEKELKKVENELRRNTKPGEAEKFVAMQLDESLPHKDELIAFFLEREFNYEIVSNPLYEKSITFRRETKYQAMGDDMKLQLMSRFEDEADVLLYLNHEDIVPKVYQEIHNDPSEDDITLTNYIQSVQSLNSSKKITLLIYGMENYFNGIGPLARTRRVGPEVSKKIYRFFTSTDPDRCLGSQRDF